MLKSLIASLALMLVAGTVQAQCPLPFFSGRAYSRPVVIAPADHIIIRGVCAPYRSRFNATVAYGGTWRTVPIINGIAPRVNVSRLSTGGKQTIYDYSHGKPYSQVRVYGRSNSNVRQRTQPKPTPLKVLPPREELDVPRQVPQRVPQQAPKQVLPPKETLQVPAVPKKVPQLEKKQEEELPLPPRQDLSEGPFEPVAPKGMSFPNDVPNVKEVVRPTYEKDKAPSK